MRTLKEIEKDYLAAIQNYQGEEKNKYLENILDELRDDHGAFCHISCGSKVVDNPTVALYRQIAKELPI